MGHLWDPRYVDAPVMRWRDADANSGNGLEETLYYCEDANWNVTTLVSAAGSVMERYVYDLYGKATVLDEDWDPVEGNQSAVANARLFQGEEFSAETGLYSSRFRTGYHPTLGVWTSRDPAGYIDGSNVYQYCLSNPAARTDPMGLCFGTAPEDLGTPPRYSITPCGIRTYEVRRRERHRRRPHLFHLAHLHTLALPCGARISRNARDTIGRCFREGFRRLRSQ